MQAKDAVLVAVEAAARINDDGQVTTVIRDARQLLNFIVETTEARQRVLTEQFRSDVPATKPGDG